MANSKDRTAASDASSNNPGNHRQSKKTGGHMGAGKSGTESLGSEKPSDRDNMGSKKPGETAPKEKK